MNKLLNLLFNILFKLKLSLRIGLILREIKFTKQLGERLIGKSLFFPSKPGPMHDGTNFFVAVVADTFKTFIDLGSSSGEVSDTIISNSKRLELGILIEPVSKQFSFLKDKYSSLEFITPLQNVIGEQNETKVRFFVNTNNSRLSSLTKGLNTSEEFVIMRSLDSLIEEFKVDHLDYLKIDAEGSDYHCLLSAKKSITENKIRFIQFEYNNSWREFKNTLVEAISFLNENGYKVFRLTSEGLFTFESNKYGDFYYLTNFIAFRDQKDITYLAKFIDQPR